MYPSRRDTRSLEWERVVVGDNSLHTIKINPWSHPTGILATPISPPTPLHTTTVIVITTIFFRIHHPLLTHPIPNLNLNSIHQWLIRDPINIAVTNLSVHIHIMMGQPWTVKWVHGVLGLVVVLNVDGDGSIRVDMFRYIHTYIHTTYNICELKLFLDLDWFTFKSVYFCRVKHDLSRYALILAFTWVCSYKIWN